MLSGRSTSGAQVEGTRGVLVEVGVIGGSGRGGTARRTHSGQAAVGRPRPMTRTYQFGWGESTSSFSITILRGELSAGTATWAQIWQLFWYWNRAHQLFQ